MNDISLEEYFKYHPPLTEERKQKHAQVNEMALAVAKAGLELNAKLMELMQFLDGNIQDPDCHQMALKACVPLLENLPDKTELLFAIQQVRMFANQGITIDELRSQGQQEQ